VPDDQEVVSGRRLTILSRIDLFVCSIDANAQDAHEHPSPVRYVPGLWRRQFSQMYSIWFSRFDCDCFHDDSFI
jgi:hypothetical protein